MILLARRTALIAIGCHMFSPAFAAPTRYQLDRAGSSVGFDFTLNGISQNGMMPIQSADIQIDPGNLAATQVDVILNAAAARTGLALATQAMTGPTVLNVARFPTIRFESLSVRLAKDGRLSDGARIEGRLTLRDVTRPIILDAALFRARGSTANDLSTIVVRLGGHLSRSAFGASGYPDLVGDRVTLDITAVIRAIR
ncbi:YceI family protein [Sedimentitalea nanhaiensis]|uniref:Polyisoprenoid-binding protein YceI n=1 Tax=Sedimentitalea nanhaiensis TaxID=999627 RepID=A0A1I7AQS6_9RHOB|nr:YceI family protein [Sedimentitalea nanhaiensis]SFT77282.1 Polyisoprenoid-binding protein YceI [Sedimentitalea nanhaiensis]